MAERLGYVELNLLSFLLCLFSFVETCLLFLNFFGASFSLGLTFEIAFVAALLNVAVAIRCYWPFKAHSFCRLELFPA